MNSLNEAVENAAKEGDAEGVGRGLFRGFMEYIATECNKAYHAGMRDGLKLQLSMYQIEARLRVMELTVDDLELSTRTRTCLRTANITTIAQFLSMKQTDVQAIPNAGIRVWREVEEMQQYLRRYE